MLAVQIHGLTKSFLSILPERIVHAEQKAHMKLRVFSISAGIINLQGECVIGQ